MFGRHIRTFTQGFRQRREAIDELNFTYRHLLRMLPNLHRRVGPGPAADVLAHQYEQDRSIRDRLVQVSMDHGQPPQPCVCADASALVEDVYHADRAGEDLDERNRSVVGALKALRAFLLRVWGRLLRALPAEEEPEYHRAVRDLQREEAEQHRELVRLGNDLHDPGRRSA
ncbi:MAG: hypothetical protein KDB84_12315 [Flavobacteriales bacterium]|nr:hypothetical protein [Flavobacteriales bacterium]